MANNVHGYTVNLKLIKSNYDTDTWHDNEWYNWDVVDGVVGSFIVLNNFKGKWENDTQYNEGDTILGDNGMLYTVKVGHTTDSDSTFIEYLSEHRNYYSEWNGTSESRQWAINMEGLVDNLDFSSKAYAISEDLIEAGSSKEWAVKEGQIGNTGLYSAKHYADIAADEVQGKQDTLVSGVNIKTINHQSILGAGNLNVSGGGGTAYIAGDGIDITDETISVNNTVLRSTDQTVQRTTNLVTSLSASSTNTEYPSAKCVYDSLQTVDVSGYAKYIDIDYDTGDGDFRAELLDKDSALISVDTVNLAIPTVVVDGYYDDTTDPSNPVIVLELSSSNSITIPAAGFVNGIQATIDDNNPLSMEYVVSGGGKIAVTNAMATLWNGYSTSKQDVISDLSTIRSNAVNGNAAYEALNYYQLKLESGTNIKTINNQSLLGSGNINISGGSGSYTAGTGIDITGNEISVDSSAVQLTAGLVTSIDSSSTDIQYPSAKLLYDKLLTKLDYTTQYGNKVTLDIDAQQNLLFKLFFNDSLDVDHQLSVASVNLGVQSIISNAQYDSLTDEIVLTFDNASQTQLRVPVTSLVNGLQPKIDALNKVDSDYISDSGCVNKFVTVSEKSTWNGKQDAIADLSDIRTNATAGAGAATTISGYGDIVTHNASEFLTSGTKVGNMFEIVTQLFDTYDLDKVLLDGRIIDYSSPELYAFIDSLARFYNNEWVGGQLFCSEAEWQTTVTNYGSCGKFVYYNEHKFRLPKLVGFLQGTNDYSDVGVSQAAGLPNITGSLYIDNTCGFLNNGGVTGAFGGLSSEITTQMRYKNSSGTCYQYCDFDASRSSGVYGRSNTVTPQNTKVLYFMKTNNNPLSHYVVISARRDWYGDSDPNTGIKLVRCNLQNYLSGDTTLIDSVNPEVDCRNETNDFGTYFGLISSNSENIVIMYGLKSSKYDIKYSLDAGKTWNSFTFSSTDFADSNDTYTYLRWFKKDDTICVAAVGPGSTKTVYTVSKEYNYVSEQYEPSLTSLFTFSDEFYSLCYCNDKYFASCQTDGKLYYSDDGTTWSDVQVGQAGTDVAAPHCRVVFWNNNYYTFVRHIESAYQWTFDVYKSEDLSTWTKTLAGESLSKVNVFLNLSVVNGTLVASYGSVVMKYTTDGTNWNIVDGYTGYSNQIKGSAAWNSFLVWSETYGNTNASISISRDRDINSLDYLRRYTMCTDLVSDFASADSMLTIIYSEENDV